MSDIRILSATEEAGLYTEACDRLHYVQETGQLVWKEVITNRAHLRGKVAGSKTSAKSVGGLVYLRIKINGVEYLAHHLVYLMLKGKWPRMGLDHVSGNTLDNRITNLREATVAVNGQNQRKSIDNSSGYTGVSFQRRDKIWVAYICVKKKRLHLGSFSTRQEAVEARKQANVTYGFSKTHGRERR